jgi:chain length determinant protein EpsF
MSLLQYFSVLRARRVVIFAILAATVAIVASVSLAIPKTYTGTATVLVDVKSSDTVGGAALGTALMPETLQAYMATQAEVISSERTARKVIKALDLDQNAVFRERYAARSVEMITFEAWLVEDLGRRLEVRPSRDRNVIEITRSDADRKIAAQVANAFAQAYLETDLELKVEPARNSAAFFEERTKAVRSKLERAQAKLTEFQRSRGILVTEERLDVENARLGELSSQLTGIQAAAVEAEAKEKNLDRLSDVIQSPLIQGLRADVAKAEARLREVSSQYGANHPLYQRTEAEVTALRGSLAAETARVAGTVVGGARINRQREARISAAYESQRKKVLTMKGSRDEASMFVRDVENASKEYEALMTRLGQTNLESLVNRTNLTILNHATEPFYPSRPKILLNVVLAVFVGLVAGVATAFAMETLDRRVRDSNDLAEVLHLPVLGVLVPAAAGGLPHGAQALRLPGAAPPPRAERDPSMPKPRAANEV